MLLKVEEASPPPGRVLIEAQATGFAGQADCATAKLHSTAITMIFIAIMKVMIDVLVRKRDRVDSVFQGANAAS